MAVVIGAVSYFVEDFLIVDADIFGTYFSDRRLTLLLYLIVLAP